MKFRARNDATLLQLLLSDGGYGTTTKARQVIKKGAAWVNDRVEKIPGALVKSGDWVEINAEKSKTAERHASYLFKVLYEDEYLIGAVKPPAMAVSKGRGGKPGFRDLVLEALHKKNPQLQQIFPVNTLDSLSTGIVLFAKNQKTMVSFQGRSIENSWVCLLEGRLKQPEGTISSDLITTHTGKVIAVERPNKQSVKASTSYRLRRPAGKFSIVEAAAEELLPRQLQAHFQYIGNPVAGEKKYGATLPFGSRNGIHLQAISFVHPVTGKKVKISSNLPQTFTRAERYT